MTHTQDHFVSPTDFMPHEPLVAYAGGKSNVSSFLIKCFPPHLLYVDLFCGGLSVTLAKPRTLSECEWVNDRYNAVANFFTVIRDMADDFADYFNYGFVIDSEELYKMWAEKLRHPVEIPDIEQAVLFWMTQQQTYTGRNAARGTSYRFRRTRFSHRHYLDLPYDRIYATHDRLQGVQIFNRDFRHILRMLKKYGDVFIFQDPPYWGVSGGGDYMELFSWEDHAELAEANLESTHKWLLTINDHPDIRELYEGKEGVYIRGYKIRYTVNRGNPQRENMELLISNFDTKVQLGPLFQMMEEDDG